MIADVRIIQSLPPATSASSQDETTAARHTTRIISTATKLNLTRQDAIVAMSEGVVNSLVELFRGIVPASPGTMILRGSIPDPDDLDRDVPVPDPDELQ